jgi:hypothetical protein
MQDVLLIDRFWVNTHTKTRPLIFHFNGPKDR